MAGASAIGGSKPAATPKTTGKAGSSGKTGSSGKASSPECTKAKASQLTTTESIASHLGGEAKVELKGFKTRASLKGRWLWRGGESWFFG